jgi:2-methylisocitrate lyase-like PEP mutase family enzyme
LTLRAENLIRKRPNMNDTIKRLQAFDAAGADVLYAPGLKDLDMVRTVCSAVSKPVNVLLGGSTDMTVEGVSAAGAKRISVGGGLAWTAYGQMIKIARRIAEDGVFDYEDSPGFGGVGKLI